ncbi:extracellular solute-binding protein [Paenibacillus sp. J5C_2022]|nr:extracellular solute-binding protein [Paenibacillus sp. J5C2022]
MKKGLSILMAVSLFGMLLTACVSNQEDNNSGAQSVDSSSSNTGSAERPTIKVAIQANPNVEDYETNHFTKLIEEGMNVNLDFIELPSKKEEALTKLALMVSSGEKLPDVIDMNLSDSIIYDYARKGVFHKLDDYLNDPTVAVNYNKVEEREFVYNMSKMADGNVYALSGYNQYVWNEGSSRAWIHSEWLNKLGLEVPTTTDEFYNVLKAFTEQDPNQNGKKDEIGMVGALGGWGQDPLVFLMNAFIYADPSKSYLMVKDGELIPSFIQPEWKQGLEYMHKLVQEGLLSPLSFTQDPTQLKSLVNVQGGMAGIVPAGSYSTFGAELENKMSLLPPIAGPAGHVSTAYNPRLPVQLWFVTKDAKDPELAVKVGDFMLDTEMSLVSRFGEKGVDWTDDPTVTSQYVGDFEQSDGLTAKIAVLNPDIWNNPQNKHWGNVNPYYQSPLMGKSIGNKRKDDADLNAKPNWHPAFATGYASVFPDEFITKLSYTPDETIQIANSKTAIDKYVIESAVAFITGNLSMSHWDDYLKELNQMGLEEYLKISQDAFDRTK